MCPVLGCFRWAVAEVKLSPTLGISDQRPLIPFMKGRKGRSVCQTSLIMKEQNANENRKTPHRKLRGL